MRLGCHMLPEVKSKERIVENMNVTSIQNNSLLSNSSTKIKNDGKVDFHTVLDAATGKNLASEIEKNYKVTLETGCGYNVNDIIKNNNFGTKNIVCISQETLLKMEQEPTLKKKILSAIEQFSSPEEQAKVDALQPPVKSAGMIVYTDGNIIYWLEGYSYNTENDQEKQSGVIESNNNNNLINQYGKIYFEETDNYFNQAMSVLSTSLIKSNLT